MNLTELLTSMTLSSFLIGISAKAGFEANQRIEHKLKLTQERNEVIHALNVIARTVRQSGFSPTSTKFPNISSTQLVGIRNSITVGKSSSLDLSKAGVFNFRKGINNVNQSDALSIKHTSLAQFNCLGHRITPKRLINGLSHQGFFAQRIDSIGIKMGMLMCQSINSNGQLQNDGILYGVEKLNFNLTPNDISPVGVVVSLTMTSGNEYSRFIAIRNIGQIN